MRALSVAAVCSFVAVIAAPTSAAPPDPLPARSVLDAKKTLEAARSNLAKAVERIEKDPPSSADLDAALAAVVALKTAIDASAELEPKDLDYAKASLAARKELRTHREYVDLRRANVHIHNSRREIDRAMSDLTTAAQRVEAKQPNVKDFEDARAAAAQLEKVLQVGQPHGSQDPKYASYLTETKTLLGRHQKAIEERWTLLAVDKQKGLVEESRRALNAALAALAGKAVSDAEFDQAERATSSLLKLLDEAKGLENSHAAYRSYATQAREAVRQAKKRIDAGWSETGLVRLKSEIEPARVDLAQAGRTLRAKNRTAEQLAEARTAAIVVRKLLEKFEHLAARSKAFGEYVGGVRKLLIEVEVDLQRPNVERAREGVAAALKTLAERNAGEDAFKAAEAALKEAQKILDQGAALAKEDRAYGGYALEVAKRFQEAEAKVAARRIEVEVGRQRAALDGARAELARALSPLEKRTPTDEQFQEANTAAIVLEKTAETAKANDPGLAKLVSEMRALVKASKSTIEKRRLQVDLERQRARVEGGRNEIAGLMKQIWGSNVPEQRLLDVEQAVERVQKILTEGIGLAEKDRDYAGYDREVKKRLDEIRASVTIRRDELLVEAQKAKVESAQKELSRAIEAIDGFGSKAAAIAAAENALQDVEAALALGLALEARLKAYNGWAKGAKKTCEQAKTRIAKRKLDLDAGDSRSQLEQLVKDAKSSLELAKQPESTDRDLTAATLSVKAVRDAIERGAALETAHQGYGNQANKARTELERMEQELESARQALAFRKETLVPLAAAISAAEAAGKLQDLRAQKQKYTEAVNGLKSCQSGGERMLDENRALASILVMVQGQKSAPKEVIALCGARLESVGQELKKVVGLLAFDSGPKKSFEAGKALLSKAKKTEALAELEECISSGKILQHSNPELKERKFEVAGAPMTLAELIEACTIEAKRIRAN